MLQWLRCSGRTMRPSVTHWGRVTQICVNKFTIIGSDNGLSPIRCQAIIRTNVGILLIRTLGTNFSEISIQIHTFSNKKMHLTMSSGKCRPFCLLNVLKHTEASWIDRFVYKALLNEHSANKSYHFDPSFPKVPYTMVQMAKPLWVQTMLMCRNHVGKGINSPTKATCIVGDGCWK